MALLVGPRGGGKSFLSALDTHLISRREPGHGTRILGASKGQAEQIYRALRRITNNTASEGDFAEILSERAVYRNGSDVEVLAASSRSVRGPHVPSLKLDEVEEMDPEVREAALGMCMNMGRHKASVLMTSTWHRLGGPIEDLMGRSRELGSPLFTYCIFDVLERCPDEISGPNLENCPTCPLMRWCHADRDALPGSLPKAKLAGGHYSVASLLQKSRAISLRTFEADYLCSGPKADGIWFPGFSTQTHVSPTAEYDPAWQVHLAVDSGVFTGAVFFQIIPSRGPADAEEIHVFADYLRENVPAEQVGRELVGVSERLCQGRLDIQRTDPCGASRNAIGPTVLAEYQRGGLRRITGWPVGGVIDGLALVDSFLQPADGTNRLFIHPRCEDLIAALQSYRRARRGGQWLDHPEDPQHPWEDLVDALRGGLRSAFPEGRQVRPAHTRRVLARQAF